MKSRSVLVVIREVTLCSHLRSVKLRSVLVVIREVVGYPLFPFKRVELALIQADIRLAGRDRWLFLCCSRRTAPQFKGRLLRCSMSVVREVTLCSRL